MNTPLSNTDLLGKLIAYDTTAPNSNYPMSDFICNYLDIPGIEIYENDCPQQNKKNLVIRVTGCESIRDETKGLTLSGHMDVVPADEPEWNSNPFELHETDEFFYGRGVVDMKGFDTLMINKARNFATEPLKHPLVLVITFDEELGLLGAQYFRDTWKNEIPLPHNALIGEPTEMHAYHAHKGAIVLTLKTIGVPAHSAYPKMGHSAITDAGRIILSLDQLADRWQNTHFEHGSLFESAQFPTLNVGMIQGGVAFNIIPDECQLTVSLRSLPGMQADELIRQVKESADSAGVREFELHTVNVGPAMLCPVNNEMYLQLCKMITQDKHYAANYTTDAGVLQEMGMNCIVWGPGHLTAMHKPNEALEKKQWVQADRQLDELIRFFCMN